MEKTVECGEGGWTLAMKIDGHKVHEDDTFPESIGFPYSTINTSNSTNIRLKWDNLFYLRIGHLHDGVILLLWPESFLFFLSYSNFVIPARFK